MTAFTDLLTTRGAAMRYAKLEPPAELGPKELGAWLTSLELAKATLIGEADDGRLAAAWTGTELHDVSTMTGVGAVLRTPTVRRLRVFNASTELRIRRSESGFLATRVTETEGNNADLAVESTHPLVGGEQRDRKPTPIHGDGVVATALRSAAGERIAVPVAWSGTKTPPQLRVRSYYTFAPSGGWVLQDTRWIALEGDRDD